MTAKSKTTGKATKAERERMDKVAGLGCILTIWKTRRYGTPGVIHHLLSGRVPGRRNSHDKTICLSPEYHTDGKASIHQLGSAGFENHHGVSEIDLLNYTNDLIA